MQKKYDAILYVEQPLNEDIVDRRVINKGKTPSQTQGFTQYSNTDDPALYHAFSFGNAVRQSLNSMGPGYSCQVIDFKKWVVVTVTHSHMITGKSSSKTFLIVFAPDKDGIVLTTHNRYRSISGVDQACSYIKSSCQALQSDTQNNRIG
jgi:hypothetical protein